MCFYTDLCHNFLQKNDNYVQPSNNVMNSTKFIAFNSSKKKKKKNRKKQKKLVKKSKSKKIS